MTREEISLESSRVLNIVVNPQDLTPKICAIYNHERNIQEDYFTSDYAGDYSGDYLDEVVYGKMYTEIIPELVAKIIGTHLEIPYEPQSDIYMGLDGSMNIDIGRMFGDGGMVSFRPYGGNCHHPNMTMVEYRGEGDDIYWGNYCDICKYCEDYP